MSEIVMDHTVDVLMEVCEERKRQRVKHGDQAHLPDGTGPSRRLVMDDVYLRHHGIDRADLAEWAKKRTDRAAQQGGDGSITFEHILTEEWAEAMAEADPDRLRAELIQVAAVAVQWIEAIDCRAPAPTALSSHGDHPGVCGRDEEANDGE